MSKRGNDEPKPVLPPGDDPRAGLSEPEKEQLVRCNKCGRAVRRGDQDPLEILREHYALDHPEHGVEAVNHPSHYGGDVVHETIKCLEAWGMEDDALLWNAAKYISRAGKKDPNKKLEDLKKAQFYLNRRIERLVEEV